MALFWNKNTKSTLRFCQNASELDTFHIFSAMDLKLAISRLDERHDPKLGHTGQAYAYGIVHDNYGHGQPLLPVQVTFSFSQALDDDDAGYGIIWKDETPDIPYYRGEVTINDPDRDTFERFRSAFEHAAVSDHSYTHLILVRKRKPYIADSREREAARIAERDRLKSLMIQIEAGEAEMPNISFDRVAFEDTLSLRAPLWSHAWHDDLLNHEMYHSRAAATWRNQPWRR